MWPSGFEAASLKVQQTGPVQTRQQRYRWNLRWELRTEVGTISHAPKDGLLEPFTRKQYEQVARYLDESLDDAMFVQRDADRVSTTIETYRHALFRELNLSEHLRTTRARSLEIHVWSDPKESQATRSIHSIEWEQLEDPKLWVGTSIRFVTVSRHIKVVSPRAKRCSERAGTSTFDVLLVVARPNIHDTPEEARRAFSILNPATIRSVLLQLQEELRNTNSSQRINLEIVRPGCFKTLKTHLEDRKTAFDGARPYHVVHFDMHGGIDEGQAFLQFNGYLDHNGKLGTTCVYAHKLAPLLRRHHVECVILNACKSAVAHAGPAANLSAGFLRHGIPAVLAMSHNMHDSISNRYYSKFYHELLVRRASISIAASKARRELFKHRLRYNYSNGKKLKMQDWFIPVVYTSSEEPYRFSKPYSWLPGSMFGSTSVQDFFLSLVVFLTIQCVITSLFYDWARTRSFYHLDLSTSIQLAPIRNPTSLVFLWTPVRIFRRLRHDWKLRQWLRVLAEDRQNCLRLEGDLRRGRMVFLHSKKDVEDEAGFFLGSIAAIWERTHFVTFGGVINAEWFVQPSDLTTLEWKLWPKACANWICLWVYSVRHRHLCSTHRDKSVVIIKNLDILYPEPVELARMQYYYPAQERFERWLKEHFPLEKRRTAPYLLLTALHGRALGDSVSKWVKDGPGRCDVLGSIVTTAFTKISKQYVDPTNESFYRGRWYDWSLSWFCGDVSRPVKTGLLSALWDLPSTLMLLTSYDANT